jgi:FdhE protein
LPRTKKSDNGIEKIKKRVASMVKERPSHKEVLKFFKNVVSEQYTIRSKVRTSPIEVDEEDFKKKIAEGFPLVEKRALTLDLPSATRLFKRLCKIMSHNKKSSKDAERLITALRKKELDLSELFNQTASNGDDYVDNLSQKLGVKKDVVTFLAKSSTKPIYEAYARELGKHVDQERWWKGYCPICGSEPLIAELRKDGARFLVCSSCGYDWRFKRLQCPFCEHEASGGAKYFYAEKEGKAYRIDVCEKCRRYIKTIDTNELGEEVIPVIEDAGTLFLDVLAQNEGYTKERTNSSPQKLS